MLKSVKYVLELLVNVFIISKALKYGFNLENDGVMIKFMKGTTSLLFDRTLNIKKRFASGKKMVPMPGEVSTLLMESRKGDTSWKIDINNLRKSEVIAEKRNTRSTAKALS